MRSVCSHFRLICCAVDSARNHVSGCGDSSELLARQHHSLRLGRNECDFRAVVWQFDDPSEISLWTALHLANTSPVSVLFSSAFVNTHCTVLVKAICMRINFGDRIVAAESALTSCEWCSRRAARTAARAFRCGSPPIRTQSPIATWAATVTSTTSGTTSSTSPRAAPLPTSPNSLLLHPILLLLQQVSHM